MYEDPKLTRSIEIELALFGEILREDCCELVRKSTERMSQVRERRQQVTDRLARSEELIARSQKICERSAR